MLFLTWAALLVEVTYDSSEEALCLTSLGLTSLGSQNILDDCSKEAFCLVSLGLTVLGSLDTLGDFFEEARGLTSLGLATGQSLTVEGAETVEHDLTFDGETLVAVGEKGHLEVVDRRR